MMNTDLWTIILARLPLKSITSSKLVCKEWKSMVESEFFRELFLRYHEKSHSSWSLMCREFPKEVLAEYGCEVWGLSRSLDSYISSFLTDKFDWCSKEKYKVSVVAYTDVGLILIKKSKANFSRRETYFVANPISRECVELPPTPPPPPPPPPPPGTLARGFKPRLSGLATQVGKKGVVLGYKAVVMNSSRSYDVITLLIYSSETGLWSYKTLPSPDIRLGRIIWLDPVSLNGSLYWLGYGFNHKEVVVSHDFYADSAECRVIYFPDTEKEPNFTRACTSSQGFLVYMNVLGDTLIVWRLDIISWEWQIVTKISLACIIKSGFDYYPLVLNPFDEDTMYLQSNIHHCLASTNLLQKGKVKYRLHNNLERSSDGRTLSFTGEWHVLTQGRFYPSYPMFVLPRWLYPIPGTSF